MNRKHPHRSDRPVAARHPRKTAGSTPHAARPPHATTSVRRPQAPEPREKQYGSAPWIYGTHAATAAIANPARTIHHILVAGESVSDLTALIEAARAAHGGDVPGITVVAKEELEKTLPRGAVHQGVAAQTSELEAVDIEDILRLLEGRTNARILILDQVTDPHNVGAILRSAAAFSVAAVVLPERHAPGASAVMAKTASGALERVPLVRVVNLARCLDQLKAANIWCVGLAGDAPQTLTQADLTGRIALVLGNEGDGLRRLTRERCDMLVRIPMANESVESLNVSNAAAIALYELARRS